MDEFVLGHFPSLESHLIGDDHIPMDPRNLFIYTRCVLFPSTWSKQKRKGESVILIPSNEELKVLRTEIQFAHDRDLLNCTGLRPDLIERMSSGFIHDRRVQRRTLSE